MAPEYTFSGYGYPSSTWTAYVASDMSPIARVNEALIPILQPRAIRLSLNLQVA